MNNHFVKRAVQMAAVVLSPLAFTPAHAATNAVTSLNDDGGSGTLRQILANASDGDTIVFTTDGAIALTNGELDITNSLIIAGPGATNLAIGGNTGNRVFNIASANAVVAISDVTICDGEAPAGSDGGGIYNEGFLTLNRCLLTNNSAGAGVEGGTVFGDGVVGGTGGTGGSGGGVYNTGSLTLTSCTFAGNTAGPGGMGGDGLYWTGGTGGTGGLGGGVYSSGSLTLTSCTLASNTAGLGGSGGYGHTGEYWGTGGQGGDGGDGGGIFSSGGLTLVSCTLAFNTAGAAGAAGYGDTYPGSPGSSGTNGGVCATADASVVFAQNSLFALNIATNGSSPDLSGTFTSMGHNLVRIIDGCSGLTNAVNDDLVGGSGCPLEPCLGPLADNGGPTPTIAPLSGSPLIDAGDDSLEGGTDQRGYPRLSGAHVDIGAVEVQFNAANANPLLLIPAWSGGTGGGAFQIAFTNAACADFTMLTTTNLALPLANWTVLGNIPEISSGQYQFTDSSTTNSPQRFYQVVTP
ncbi:MAG: choice-of-anchor Q domain-containing protein [Verrucomicrobiota bacterium]|jgi:hypothetical protein